MKTYQIKKINLRNLYLFSLFGLILSLLILILLISATIYLFPKFDYINLFIIIYSIIIGNLIFKITTNKCSKIIKIKINKTKIEIEDETFLFETIDKITTNNLLFTYYPKLTICFFDNKKIAFRMDKNHKDYWKLLGNLKEITIDGRKII
jgi:hypothetical protein